MITRIDHVAVVVKDIEQALTVFQDALGLEASQTSMVPDQGVKIAFLPIGESDIELLEPIDDESGVARFLAQRGEGMHHICLEVDDIDAALLRLQDKGVRLINRSAVAGAHGRVAFIHPKSTHGIMIELVETDRVQTEASHIHRPPA